MRLKSLARILAINLAILVAGVLVAEGVFGNWFARDPMTFLKIPRNGKWLFEVEYPGSTPGENTNIYTRDQYGLRGQYRQPEDINLVTIGGSTTEQRYIDDDETWQEVLENGFRQSGREFEIVNAGHSGRTTYGHIHDLQVWLPLVPGLQPDYYLFYLGINDMFYDVGDEGNQIYRDRDTWKDIVKTRSALYHLYRTTMGAYVAKKYNIAHAWIDYANAQWTDSPVRDDYIQVLGPRLSFYREVKSQGATAIYVTQKRGDYRIRDGRAEGLVNTNASAGQSFTDPRLGFLDPSTANGLDYQLILDQFNQELMAFCREVEAICIDLAADLEFEPGDFYDHVHNTEQGAARIGNYLYDKLKQVL